MLVARHSRHLCGSCRKQLLSFLDFSTPLSPIHPYRSLRHKTLHLSTRAFYPASFHHTRDKWATYDPENLRTFQTARNKGDIESIVRQAHEDYGETLPEDYLDAEELATYERLYGKPNLIPEQEFRIHEARKYFGDTVPENWLDDEELATYIKLYGSPTIVPEAEFWYQASEAKPGSEESSCRARTNSNALLKQNADGLLEEVEYDHEALSTANMEAFREELNHRKRRKGSPRKVLEEVKSLGEQGLPDDSGDGIKLDSNNGELAGEADHIGDFPAQDAHRVDAETYLDSLSEREVQHDPRTHPSTLEGRSGTHPSALILPQDTFVSPITSVLSNTSNKHLTEFALKIFGGHKFPDSVATPNSKDHLQQKPISLEAGQQNMRTMEASVYLAAMFPGLYASITSILVETRKRLGSNWLEGLLKIPGGPRILDAGGGGAGVLAFRDILRAEWERLRPEEAREPAPLGKATVVTGSYELRSGVSKLLVDTSFLPRIPDFSPTRDIPGASEFNASARKQYDIVIAPHTLWKLEEDYMRKHQVQNYWSLLKPDGGVLILIEKGVPRGFELVAGAREALLENHILSSASDSSTEEDLTSKHRGLKRVTKERGMIIAPCTNHSKCPMYTIPGEMVRRKEYCHFQQRYHRPTFLQRMHRDNCNHEDIRFSYIAVQRGKDLRREKNIAQNEEATLAALQGYGDREIVPNVLSLPRVIYQPQKRHKHVKLDVCTPSAQIECWTMTARTSKQGYRDARKAQWGDLWALGAKVRVVRKVRTGQPKKSIQYRRGIEENVDDEGDSKFEAIDFDMAKYKQKHRGKVTS